MQSRTLSRELALLMLGQISDRGGAKPVLPTAMDGLLQQVLATLSQHVRDALDRSAEDLPSSSYWTASCRSRVSSSCLGCVST